MTTITLPRATVEQTLEALEWISDCHVGDDDDAGECASCHERSYKPHAPDCKKNNAITALRAALAQQAEPEGSVCARCGALAFDPVLPQQAEPVEPVATLTAQRDALLEVLKYLDKAFRQHGRQHWPEAVRVGAAIKAVEEQK